MIKRIRTIALGMLALSAPFAAQVKVTSVAVNPNDSTEVWVCNRDNDSVSVIDASTGTVTHEIAVGVKPRSLAFSADGSKVFVANLRGDIDLDTSFITPFTGLEVRSSVSVITVASKTVTDTITDVGIEPYGLIVAPNGEYFAVSGFRSGTIKFYDADTHAHLHTHQFLHSLDVFPDPFTINDVDSDEDFLADNGEPRAMAMTADSQTIFVTHLIPGFVSEVTVTLNGGGLPTATSHTSTNLNDYLPHPILNPIPVQTLESQGVPRFLDDIAINSDGSKALIPHVLHNLNHDVNFAFAGLAGDFANRVYPALTILDTAGGTFDRLHHELDDNPDPAAVVPVGVGKATNGAVLSYGSDDPAILGGLTTMRLSGPTDPGLGFMFFGPEIEVDLGFNGIIYALPQSGIFLPMPAAGAGLFELPINVPNDLSLDGIALMTQALWVDNASGFFYFSNGARMVFGTESAGAGKMGHRAGQPGRAEFADGGNKVLMLNRGSEDVFLYDASNGSANYELLTVFPPRNQHVERAALDTTTPMGDLPLGMVLADDPSTVNNDSLLYIINEGTRTLSTLRVDWDTNVIQKAADQLLTITGPDKFTLSERIGQELFEDASRAQTAGNFNNSCASCHFEGGADGNVWQRPAGPRSTMPIYGGTLGTGTILWKGVRLNMGETGPMFGGENGGTGIFTQAEMQGLIDYHEVVPFPINPNLDPITGAYSTEAALGKDLFFGTNDTGLNPTGRNAGCFNCHPDADGLDPRAYTTDFLDPLLTGDPLGLENNDSLCFSLQENVAQANNIRNVNSAVNSDEFLPVGPDDDRNVDGYSDIEAYSPMNVDGPDDFTRDDPNGYLCPQDGIPGNPKKVFGRPAKLFSVPTKMGAFSTGPYFHDHSAQSLRTIVDPSSQRDDPKYGDPGRIHLQKFFNEFHDLRGHEDIVPGASKVQLDLQSVDVEADIEAVLAYISSL